MSRERLIRLGLIKVRRPALSIRGHRACAYWLKACIDLGWPRTDLPRLEGLFWQHHDNNGKLLHAKRG